MGSPAKIFHVKRKKQNYSNGETSEVNYNRFMVDCRVDFFLCEPDCSLNRDASGASRYRYACS